MSQAFIVPTIKRPFPSKREIALLSDDEIGKAIKTANGRARYLQAEAAGHQRNEARLLRELKVRRRITGNLAEIKT